MPAYTGLRGWHLPYRTGIVPNRDGPTVLVLSHLDEVLDLLVDGRLLVVGAHGETSDLSHQRVVGGTAHHGSAGALGAARSEEGQVLPSQEKIKKDVQRGAEAGNQSTSHARYFSQYSGTVMFFQGVG